MDIKFHVRSQKNCKQNRSKKTQTTINAINTSNHQHVNENSRITQKKKELKSFDIVFFHNDYNQSRHTRS